jgi:hypothetical protein
MVFLDQVYIPRKPVNIHLLRGEVVPATRPRDISHLLAQFLPPCDENCSCPPRELFATPCYLY